MNSKIKRLTKNFSYTLSSNLIGLLISTLVVLIIPKLVGVKEYGFWQLYLFYSSYVGFMQFGWNDGIYLRYSGQEYSILDKKKFYSQFLSMILFQVLIATLLFFYSYNSICDIDRRIILYMVGFNLIIMNSRSMLIFILQGTNRIKNYAQITLLDRIVYISLVFSFILIGIRDYRIMIAADIFGKFASLVYSIFCCKELVFRKISEFKFDFNEISTNIKVGIKLMIANIASTLIIGVVRFGIARTWDVSTFGKISLTLSVSNFMMLFINAMGIVMLPALRKTDYNKIKDIYLVLRNFLMVISLFILILYYPFKTLLSLWLPQYRDSLLYMAILFPIFVFEGKTALLVNTYLKTIRKESIMLKVNIISVITSIILTYISTQLFNNLDLTVVVLVTVLVFKSIISEIELTKVIGKAVSKDILLELSLITVFIFTGWYIDSWLSTLLYLLTYIIYVCVKNQDIKRSIRSLRILIR